MFFESPTLNSKAWLGQVWTFCVCFHQVVFHVVFIPTLSKIADNDAAWCLKSITFERIANDDFLVPSFPLKYWLDAHFTCLETWQSSSSGDVRESHPVPCHTLPWTIWVKVELPWSSVCWFLFFLKDPYNLMNLKTLGQNYYAFFPLPSPFPRYYFWNSFCWFSFPFEWFSESSPLSHHAVGPC